MTTEESIRRDLIDLCGKVSDTSIVLLVYIAELKGIADNDEAMQAFMKGFRERMAFAESQRKNDPLWKPLLEEPDARIS